MFQITRFVMEDFIDSLEQTIYIVSLNKRYMVYNASRRRLVMDAVKHMDAGQSPLDLITLENLCAWTRTSRYRVMGEGAFAPSHITYRVAVVESRDRYDLHQMMRRLLTPTIVADLPRLARSQLSTRVEKIVESYAKKNDPTVDQSPPIPSARFKDSWYYDHSKDYFKIARKHYADFGRLVARAKAGDESITNDELRSAFFELSGRYSEAGSHIENAFNAIEGMGDMEITHCDCGHYEDSNNTHDVRNDTWCDSCFDDNAVFVEDENEYWPRDDAYYSETRDAYYSYDRDEDDDNDDDDDDNDRNQPIMSYSTNVLHVLDYPSGIKSSHFGEFTLGIELEMTSGDNDCNEAAELVRSRLGSDYCIIKSDGSLPSNGFEVVTSPQGLAKHIEKFKAWEIDPAYRAWNTGKCGTHVHIDSRGFTQLTLGKFLMFINSAGNVDFIRKIAGRHPSVDEQARSYCAAEHQSILANPKKAVKGKSGERYRMVNMCNLGGREAQRLGLSMDNSYNGKYNTVELRIFRASLKKERLLAQIEFTHASVMFCRVASWRDLNGTSFVKWLKTVAGQYPALTKWYGVRQVHTSTPTVIAPAQDTCSDAVPPAPWQPADTENRHDREYPVHMPYDNEAETIRAWVTRAGLYFRFATYAGSEYAYFPYGGDLDTISSRDVVYMRVGELWVLMNEGFAASLAQSSYTVSLEQPV
jgi:hypothetical protein